MASYQDRTTHEECGVFGVCGVENAASLTYYGLHSLQHRGQEGCGIVSVDNRVFHRVKGEGLVTEVFNEDNIKTLTGNMAIGHVRYSTTGGGGIDNVQPFLFMHSTGDFALAHNGNLVNSVQLRTFLEERGSLFHSTSDSEIFAHLIKKETGKTAQEYIQLKLIDAAKDRLLDPSRTVGQVAYELGFQYPQHFTRLFKKVTGQTPNAYRTRA